MQNDMNPVLTEEQIQRIGLMSLPARPEPGSTIQFARAIEREVLRVLADREGRQPIAWLTRDEEGSPSMLFFDYGEACTYCDPDEQPEPLGLIAQRANSAPEPTPDRYVVLKAPGSRYAYVNDTQEGKTVKRYDVLKGDGWAKAESHARVLNAHERTQRAREDVDASGT
ncbi:hypothetical protein V8Z80_08195 [Orrella sp. JC864]|uniref:hypothetical protein n=1 Tax=Orrella sp. JC864 TaxID=3120298 RepID=UPI003009541C